MADPAPVSRKGGGVGVNSGDVAQVPFYGARRLSLVKPETLLGSYRGENPTFKQKRQALHSLSASKGFKPNQSPAHVCRTLRLPRRVSAHPSNTLVKAPGPSISAMAN